MFQRAVTKFGLAAHIALLAALPVALTPFLSAQWLGKTILWLTLFAVVWILLAPSIRSGEGLGMARRRVLGGIVRDPMTWFFVLAAVMMWLAKLNGGVELFYDAETTQWIIKTPPVEELMSSVPGAGFLPLATTIGVAVCVLGVRHAMGRQARTWCGLAAAFIAGCGAFALAALTFTGAEGFAGACLRNFGDAPFFGSFFIMWLFMAITCGAQAEAEGWGAARLPMAVAVGGNVTAVAFFLPPLASAIVFGVALVFLMTSLAYAARAGKGGAAARAFVMCVFGILMTALVVMMCASEEIRTAKVEQILAAEPEKEPIEDTFDEDTDPTPDEVLSRIAQQMWLTAPWSGVGIGAYNLNVPFYAEDADWRILPPKVDWPVNGYWGLLAERGITGCAIIAVGLAFLVVFWFIRAVEAFFAVRASDDHDVYFFAVQPVSWCILPAFALCCADARFSSVLRFDAVAFSIALPFALAVASFPRLKKKKNTEEK
ncbi:MAG: hypothetical protein IJ802_02185 [Kiritimatiellae bacterium]|nr:hypothetical protein [Kiritimatiellia bacterium]